MPASNERIPNRPLSGQELAKIIEKDVHTILNRDGMFTSNIAFARVAYEVRVTLHMDNPMYSKHEAVVTSKIASKQEVEQSPELASIEPGPLAKPLTEAETVFSEERHRQIASPNMARIENEMPVYMEKKNMDTGVVELKEQKYVGDIPDPLSVGNLVADKAVSEDQRSKWNRPKKEKK